MKKTNASPSPAPVAPRNPTSEELEDTLPNPETLILMAEDAAPKVSVERYWPSVSILRSKNYSWREISDWLAKAGVDLHYKRLERHAKTLREERAERAAARGEDDES